MVRVVITLVILLVALAGGGIAGHFLRPMPEIKEETGRTAPPPTATAPFSVTFRDPFLVPVLRDGRDWTHVVLSLGVEAHSVPQDVVRGLEPVIRDGLTEALFLHGSVGDFDGDFTETMTLNRLRKRLNAVVTRITGDEAARILIISMARQNA
jgi:hypothetical protein